MATRRFLLRLLTGFILLATSTVAWAKPRVMFLVDPTYRTAVAEVANLLKPQIDAVIVPPPFPYSSQTVLENIDKLLGDGKWDLIYFNVGQVDMTYRAPGMKSFRIMNPEVGGQITATPQDYAKNLEAIVKRLTTAKLNVVWASNLPAAGTGLRVQTAGSEAEYNKAAATVMTQLHVPISDIGGKLPKLAPIKPAQGRKPGPLDKQPIHLPIIEDVCTALKLPQPPPPQ